jgi:uncharacterized protein
MGFQKMTIGLIITLILIGFIAGGLSGFVGIGGGVVIVPALVYILGLSQHEAQGTSLLLMLPPIGILAVMNYYRAGHINWTYGAIIAGAFIAGGYVGSKLSLKLSPGIVKLSFGIIMAYVAFMMIRSGYNLLKNEQ